MPSFEFQDGGVEREPRAGRNRTPAYVHYYDIIPQTPAPQDSAGLDIIIDDRGYGAAVEQRLTDQNGNTVTTL